MLDALLLPFRAYRDFVRRQKVGPGHCVGCGKKSDVRECDECYAHRSAW